MMKEMVDLIVNIEPRLDGLCEVHYEQADGLFINGYGLCGVCCNCAGVDDNETTKVFRSGGADPDGNQPGDLYVIIKVREDPVFRRDVADIHVNAVLSITQAILGGTIQVPTLRGDVVLKQNSVASGLQWWGPEAWFFVVAFAQFSFGAWLVVG
ncbi:hypothetical protein U1Q18_043714 [Sarracenia purpurea var. burkii]